MEEKKYKITFIVRASSLDEAYDKLDEEIKEAIQTEDSVARLIHGIDPE
jgi:hypothetical protein